MSKTVGELVNKRGQKLFTVKWTPSTAPVAVLFWHHGFGEYCERLDASFQVFAEAGIMVYSYDAHNMGKSESRKPEDQCFVEHFHYLVDDAVQYTEHIQADMKADNITAPMFIAGNSLGGLIISYVVAERPSVFAGHIMQSPAINVEWNPVLRIQAAVGGLMAVLTPRAKLVDAVRPEDMSQDPQVIKEFMEDPMMYKGSVMCRSGNEILKGFKGLVKLRSKIKVPVLIVFGTKDKCTNFQAAKEHLAAIPATDKTFKEVEGGYHELLMGPEKETVRGWIVDWVSEHAKGAPAPAAAEPAPAAAEAAAAAAPAAEEAVAAEPEAKPVAAPEAAEPKAEPPAEAEVKAPEAPAAEAEVKAPEAEVKAPEGSEAEVAKAEEPAAAGNAHVAA